MAVSQTPPSKNVAKSIYENLLEKIRNNPNLPALGSSVSHVVQLASSNDEAVRNLAHFILSDVALAQKILRIANTVGYRTASGNAVTTISRAIFLLGFETVKSSALAMMLVDGMSGKSAHHVRAELAQAMGASVVGREVARRSLQKDPEEAAVAALFKNIGRLLVASHDSQLYTKMMDLVASGKYSLEQASLQLLGGNLDLLAQSVLHDWRIPETIVDALSPLPAGTLKPAKNRHEWLQQVAEFSVTAVSLLPHLGELGYEAAGRALLARFGTALSLDEEKLRGILTIAAQETRAVADSLDLPKHTQLEQKRPVVEMNVTLQNVDHSLPDELLLATGDKDAFSADAKHASGKPMNARDLLLAGVQDISEMMASGRCKPNDLIMLVLETLYHSMGFRFATVCIKDLKTNEFRARISLGEKNAIRQTNFFFSGNSTRDVFHLSLENDADLFISDATSPKIHDLIPAWHRTLLPDARSFMVLPMIVQKKHFGLFYGDRQNLAPEGVPPDETALIKTLKGQLLAALNSR